MIRATEDIDSLRRIDLKTILELFGAIRDRYDKKKWHTDKGIISVSDQKFFNWNMAEGGGGAIDLVIHLKICDFKTAINWLKEQFPSIINYGQTECTSVVTRRLRPTLQLPQRDDTKLDQVRNYLQMVRHIDARLVKLLLEQGTLYADSRANMVFLLLGKEKVVVGAELRGTTSCRWRGMAIGSRKDLGYFSIQCCQTKPAVLCESGIDAMSYLALDSGSLAISTSGVNTNPVWLQWLIDQGYEIFCGFDADCPGDSMAQRMLQLYPTVKRLRPTKQDWNDLLISRHI